MYLTRIQYCAFFQTAFYPLLINTMYFFNFAKIYMFEAVIIKY